MLPCTHKVVHNIERSTVFLQVVIPIRLNAKVMKFNEVWQHGFDITRKTNAAMNELRSDFVDRNTNNLI